MSDPQFHDIEQRSKEWHEKRLRMPTASRFHEIVTPKGSLSDRRFAYAGEILYQRFHGVAVEKRRTEWMDRGVEYEEDAIRGFNKIFPHFKIAKGGFVTDGKVGCSPDGLITNGNVRLGLEVKVPAPWTHYKYLGFGLGEDYKAQVQGQMLIAGLDWVHFYSWQPEPDVPSFHLCTERDETFIKALKEGLKLFCKELDDAEAKIKKLAPMK